jgi:hypothetical protein
MAAMTITTVATPRRSTIELFMGLHFMWEPDDWTTMAGVSLLRQQ